MKNFKTLNIKQVYPLSTHVHYLIIYNPCSVQSHWHTSLHLHFNYTTQWTTDVVWDLGLFLLQDRSQTSRIWFWSWSWSGRLCSWSWACYACLGLVWV